MGWPVAPHGLRLHITQHRPLITVTNPAVQTLLVHGWIYFGPNNINQISRKLLLQFTRQLLLNGIRRF